MFNADPSPPLPTLSTEMIQKSLEENKELIMAIMEGQNQGKLAEVSICLAKLQQNLTYLAKLADDATPPPPQMQSQGQGMQHPHVTMSQQQDLSTVNMSFDMNDQQQHHLAMSLQQSNISNSKLPFQMNESELKMPAYFQQQQQQQLITGPMVNLGFGGYQAGQFRLNNLSDMPETNQIGSDVSPVWSLGKSPSTYGNARS